MYGKEIEYYNNVQFAYMADIWGLIGGALSVIGFIEAVIWVLGYGPKSSNDIVYSYYDYEKSASIEEKDYEFSWGSDFFILRSYTLEKFPITSEVTVSCKPLVHPRRPLSGENYEIKVNDEKRIILKKSAGFTDRDFEKIIIKTETPVTDPQYKNNISHSIEGDRIVITNGNEAEVRNYLIELPENVTLNKIPYNSNISSLTVPEEDDLGGKIVIKIRKISGKSGNEPYQLVIPLLS